MQPELAAFLCRRFGSLEASLIERRWREAFALADGEPARAGERHEEYDDLVTLLLEHAVDASEEVWAVAHWIAFSCMGDNHLWEDLGLPQRPALTSLIADCFPTLRALNTRDMRWKKFFYKQLCERAEVFLCRSPTCDLCSEYEVCFEPRPALRVPEVVEAGGARQSTASQGSS
jgi:nitrogen fixation protein NifQ